MKTLLETGYVSVFDYDDCVEVLTQGEIFKVTDKDSIINIRAYYNKLVSDTFWVTTNKSILAEAALTAILPMITASHLLGMYAHTFQSGESYGKSEALKGVRKAIGLKE
jgi:hypothetical protein